jgi:bidirectional [NiFe] hydrogenase diaphorase subunit
MVKTLNRSSQMKEFSKTDVRFKKILAIIAKNQKRPDTLIEVLHIAQDLFGYLPLQVIQFVSKEMSIDPSQVFGVVTFYNFFTLKPKGKHNCLVCTGTACYVKGAQAITDQISKDFAIKAGQTTKDNKLGLQTARCIGACSLAPAVVFDNEILAKVNPAEITNMINTKMGAKKSES